MKENTKKLVEAFGFLKLDEAQLLMDTADMMLAGSVVVNVGAGVGTSALAILEQRPDLAPTFYTVDIRDDDNPFGSLIGEQHAFQNAKMERLLPVQIKGDSSSVGKAWDKGEIDFLIIDADHTRAGLMKDIRAWLPHLSVGGYVAFHDYTFPKWPDVYEVIQETMLRDINYEAVAFKGTMVLFKKLAPRPIIVEENELSASIATEQTEEETKTEAVAEKKPAKRKKSSKTIDKPSGE